MKNRPAGSKDFFGALLQLKSKKSEQMEDEKLYRAYCQKHSDQKYELVIFNDFCNGAKVSVFWTTCHNFWLLLPSEAKLRTKLESKGTMMMLQ